MDLEPLKQLTTDLMPTTQVFDHNEHFLSNPITSKIECTYMTCL